MIGGVREPPASQEEAGGKAVSSQAGDDQTRAEETAEAETRGPQEAFARAVLRDWDSGAAVRGALQTAKASVASKELMPAISFPSTVPQVEAQRVASLEPVMQVKWLEHFKLLELEGIYLQTNRGRSTTEEQQRLVELTQAAMSAPDSAAALAAAGLTGITGSATKSLHIYGLAYDGEPRPKNERTWQRYGETAESLGLVWGGRWTRKLPDSGTVVTDRPHVQYPGDSGVLRGLAGAGLLTVLTFGLAAVVRHTLTERG